MRLERIILAGLFLLWSVAALSQALWPEARWLLVGVGLVTAGFVLFHLTVFALRRQRGYWVEYVSPGLALQEDEDFAVVYHEGSRKLMLMGRQRPKPEADILFVPAEGSWSRRVEPWAQSRRAQILARLQRHPVSGHCEIRSSSLP